MNIRRGWFLLIGLIIGLLLGGAFFFVFNVQKPVKLGTNSSSMAMPASSANYASETDLPGPAATPAVLPQVQVRSGPTPTYLYNAKGQLQAIIYPDGSNYTYQYDPYGDKISETNGAGKTWSYIYDQNHRPLSVIDPDGRVTRQK